MKLAHARSRADLIASNPFGHSAEALAAPPPPPGPGKPNPPTEKPAVEPEKPEASANADTQVTAAISAVKEALDAAIKAQQADDDDDPKDKKVAQGLEQLAGQLAELMKAQADDAGQPPEAPEKPDAEPEAPPVTAAGAAPEKPETNPVDADGNVQPDAQCTNPDCAHTAASHVDTPDGERTGACGMADCQCLGMQIETQPNKGTGDSGEQSDVSGKLAAVPPVKAPATEPEPDADTDSNLNAPPELPGGDAMGPAFTIPVAIIEGQPTGDGRQIAPEALSWRTPPLPLMGLATETHDPMGMDMNAPAVICGRIDSFARAKGEGDTQIISAKGFFLNNSDGSYFAELVEGMGRVGVSADVAVEMVDMEVTDTDSDGFPMDMTETLTKGLIMGLTVCPYPAFEGAYIVLGDGTDSPAAKPIPERADVPDQAPPLVANGGQLIHLMAFEQCEPCDQGLEIVASAAPSRPPKAWFSNPNFHPDDGRMVEILDRRGQRVIGGKFACPLTVTDDGRVYGHIAPWGICHTGTAGQCILAPRSKVDYAHFKRGQHLVTAEGEKIRVGVITCDAGHASTRGISASQAMAHYDNTALAAADVNIGDDEHGIWVAGALRPDVTEEQVRKLTAASISGDWRSMGGTLELVAALAVNQPGFPLAQVASGHHEALVAAGASVMHAAKHPRGKQDDDPAVAAIRFMDSRDKLRRMSKQDSQRRLRLVR